MKQFAVYIVASGRNGTIYIGMTSNLAARIWQHKEKAIDWADLYPSILG
jgi:putative endonuclease